MSIWKCLTGCCTLGQERYRHAQFRGSDRLILKGRFCGKNAPHWVLFFTQGAECRFHLARGSGSEKGDRPPDSRMSALFAVYSALAKTSGVPSGRLIPQSLSPKGFSRQITPNSLQGKCLDSGGFKA